MLQGEIIERTITTVIVDESLRVLHCVTSTWMKSDKNIDDMLEKGTHACTSRKNFSCDNDKIFNIV